MYEVVGFNPVSFTDQSTGQLIEGSTIHLVSDSESSGILYGREVLSKFFAKERIKGALKVGALAELKFSVSAGKVKISGIDIIS